jgi:hypothetical protein
MFAFKIHLMGFSFHLFYVFSLVSLINEVYIEGNVENLSNYIILLSVCIIYPFIYDTTQLIKAGISEYFSETSNFSDMIYIYGGIANIIMLDLFDPYQFQNKLIMTILILQQIVKTFFFLRIFEKLSYIVTMLSVVIADLRAFLLFYTIMICLFGMVPAILQLANKNEAVNSEFYQHFIEVDVIDAPFGEYYNLGLFLGYIIQTLRISLGDFNFDASKYLS